MVSTLEPPTASSVSRRGPSSIVSRQSQSHSRSKRYNRSHTGGSTNTTHALQNDFPVFGTGDVEIIVRARDTPQDAAPVQNRYLLHRHTLTRSSGFFETSTSNQWSRTRALPAGNELSRIGEDGEIDPVTGSDVSSRSQRGSVHPPRKRWRYELDPQSGPNDIPMLVQRDESSRDNTQSLFGPSSAPPTVSSRDSRSSSRSKHSHSRSVSNSSTSSGFFRSVANLSLSSNHPPPAAELSQADEDLLRDYDNLFRIFYNYPPVLDGVNVADAYVQCKSLLNLADQYDALAVVGPRVDHHMLQFQSRLWKQIAKYPISYLRLGYLARSRVIFQEALIHVVGQWPAGERSLRAALPDIVLDIIEDKVEELEETVGRIEGRLFRLGLTNSRGERVGPSNSYLDWLSISLFRQWLADNTSPQPPPDQRRRITSRDGGRSVAALPPASPPLNSVGRAYRQIGSNNPASFLGHDDCKRFLKLTPELYSRENLRRFEKRLDELKAMAREVVRPLMGSNLELDMGDTSRTPDSITYLTCTTVGNRDLPWVMDDQNTVGLIAN